MEIPFSPASDRNKEPILKVLQEVLTLNTGRILEIGAGTGQHAVYMSPYFPQLKWTMSDRAEVVPALKRVVEEANLRNLTPPFKLEIGVDDVAKFIYDIIYTANTFHIMSWKECKTLIKLAGHRLPEEGRFIVYGPFNYDQKFTSESNEAFDKSLRERDPASGIRAFEDVDRAMVKNGFALVKDYEMPANNRVLVYKRLKFVRKT
nr:Protein of unknown function DUF938 [uncultured organism]